MTAQPHTTQVRWTTDLPCSIVRAERDLFSRIYPGFVRDVTAHFADFEQVAYSEYGGALLSVAGSRRRFVSIGSQEVVISGVGGVKTAPESRMQGSARQTLGALAATFLAGGRCESDFGFLQCREEITSFYEAVGWTRVDNIVRHIDTLDGRTPVTTAGPTLVIAGRSDVDDWPCGMVDLRGLPW